MNRTACEYGESLSESSSLASIQHFNCFGAREYLRSNLIKRVELSHLRLKLHYVHEVSQKLRQLPDRAASSALLADNGRPHLVRVSPLVRGKEVL